LDKIFGINNFRNEIIWSYKRYTATSNKFQNLHDTIFWYTKSVKHTFNEVREEYGEKSGKMDSHYKQDENGKWFRWQKRKDQEPYKIYLSEGRRAGDVWEMSIINASSKERIGYPTQKPEALLQRIIECASDENNIIFDPFVGGGTTVAVADKLNRQWIGIDQSVQAVKVTELRLERQRNLFSQPFAVRLHKYDYDTLRNKSAFEFESWIIQQFVGISNTKQRGDLGLDGKKNGVPVQVKRSDNIGRNVIDNFKSAIERDDKKLLDKNVKDNKAVGYIIAFSFSKGAIEEVARLKLKEGIIIELVKVEDIVPISKKPNLKLEMTAMQKNTKDIWEIEFSAKGESDAGIEFYSWDFAYDDEAGFRAEVMIDKSGTQKHTFKADSHSVAVKVFDNDGLENIEVVKLKVNGDVERV
jgi:tRNA G10  N-methylase Trm11